MQVDVHRIDAEIARPHLADDGVEVRAVGVEIGARRVHRVGDRHDVALEQPAGVRIGQHDGGDVLREALLHLLRIDRAVRPRRHRFDPIAEQRRGRRIGAVRGIRHQHDRARLAARRERRLDRHHAAQLAMRARLRRHRDRRHAGELAQPARQLGDQRDRARHGRLRLQRMHVAEARQPRHLLVQPRIVLHGAGAERKHAGVDAVVHAREPHIMAHRLPAPRGPAGRSAPCAPARRGAA